MNAASKFNGKLAVSYLRVSSDEQEKEGFSIPSQKKLLDNYAVENGLTIAEEYTDVETAKQAGRTGFNSMVTFLKKQSKVMNEKSDA